MTVLESGKTMAVIRKPQFGVGDRGKVMLWFTVYTSETLAALQVFTPEQAVEIIEAYGVDDVSKLDGKPCWVDTSSNPGLMLWAGAWKA